MSNQSLAPAALYPSAQFDYAQVVVTTGTKTVYVSGQTAWDRDLKVGDANDVPSQLKRALENVRHALAAAGATPSDLVYIRIYIVNYSADLLSQIMPILHQFLDPAHLPGSTLLGVQALAVPELLVEIDATAVLKA